MEITAKSVKIAQKPAKITEKIEGYSSSVQVIQAWRLGTYVIQACASHPADKN